MPKLIPLPAVADLLDDGPVLKAAIQYKRGKKGHGCRKCIAGRREDCSSVREAAVARGEKSCLDREQSYYILLPLKKSEVH